MNVIVTHVNHFGKLFHCGGKIIVGLLYKSVQVKFCPLVVNHGGLLVDVESLTVLFSMRIESLAYRIQSEYSRSERVGGIHGRGRTSGEQG